MLFEDTQKERLVDGVVHALGVVMSVIAVPVLLHRVISAGNGRLILAAVVYSAGLIAMLWLSAAYNLATHPGWKEEIRRYDHAAIFLMIAGTYTPFALIAVGGTIGLGLLILVWLVAIGGMMLKLLRPRRFDRASVVLYLALGWVILPAMGLVVATLPTSALVLLVVGGLLYTVGVAFHVWETLPYQNAVWHGFVLVAASCHFVAVLRVVAD
jgi:hemolysin III